MKKALAFFTAIIVLVSFFPACSSPSASSPQASAAPTATRIQATSSPATTASSAPKRDIEGTERVWMSVFQPADLIDTAAWEYVSSNLDTVSVFIDVLYETDIDVTREFAGMLRTTGIRLSVECAGLLDTFAAEYTPGTDTFGRHSAEYETAKLSRLKKAGYDVDYVVFDHPITRAIYPNEDYTQAPRMSYDEAAQQLATAMQCWREVYPDVKFIYCVNFPNHGWKGGPAYFRLADETGRGDFYEELQAVLQATDEAGVDFYGLVADNPYDYATGQPYSDQAVSSTDWMARVVDLENEVKSRGLTFALFFNSENPGTTGPEGEYYRQTLSYINDYAAAGGDPDIFFIESWYTYPLEAVPETERYSMTYIAASVIRQVKFGQPADLTDIDMSEKALPEALPSADNWQFDARVEGWVDISDIGEMGVEDGALRIVCTGGDPYILSADHLNLDTSGYTTLHIRVRNTTDSGTLTVFFATDSEPYFDESKSVNASMTPHAADYQDIWLTVGANASWTGTLRRLRIDTGDRTGVVYIDFISLE